MAAHCESGAVTAQLNHAGLDISEPMVFGISGGLFFGYFKIPSLDFPTIVLRNQPGNIRKAIQKRLGVSISSSSNKNPEKMMGDLDELLSRDIVVAVQVDFFYMDYLPAYARAHFNAHFVNIVGKEEGKYIISDSYFPQLAKLDGETLKIARSAKGPFAPNGFHFHITKVQNDIDMKKAIRAGIRQTCFYMLNVPIPFMGIRGIRCFGDKILTWPKLCDNIDQLSHQVMMVSIIFEDRGTGGGGFRYLYASFLKEAAALLGHEGLDQLAGAMMRNGDEWRKISLAAARAGKNRDLGQESLQRLRVMIHGRADEEKKIFKNLQKLAKTL